MKKNTKMKLVIGVLLMSLILCLMIYKINKQEEETVYNVKVESISSVSSLETTYSTNGNLQLRNDKIHAVSVQYNAVIEEIYVKNGDPIEEGQQLLKVKRLSDDVEVIIESDFSGKVKFSKDFYIGSMLSQFTTILTINQLNGADDFYIKVQIPSYVYENMSTLSSADITFPDLISEINLVGILDQNSIQVEQMNNINYYNILININDSEMQLEDYNLLEGMSVSVTLHATSEFSKDTDSNALYYEVPFSAIVTRDDKNVIFVYDSKGTEFYAKMVVVDLINTNGDTAVIKVDGTSYMNQKSYLITQGNYNLTGSEMVNAQ